MAHNNGVYRHERDYKVVLVLYLVFHRCFQLFVPGDKRQLGSPELHFKADDTAIMLPIMIEGARIIIDRYICL